MIARWSLAMALVLGCGTKSAPPPVTGAKDDTAQKRHTPVDAPKAKKATACPTLAVTADEAKVAFEQAEALEAKITAGKLDRKSSWGDRYELYDRSATGGHRDAQARAGRMMFSSMFTVKTPTAAQRTEYVRAIARLLVAARRGNTDAASFMPGMETLMFGRLPDPLEPPMSQLKKEWIEDAIRTADHWLKCQAGMKK